MTLLFEVDRSTALALASVAVSLRVTQVVNKPGVYTRFWQTGRSGTHTNPPEAQLPSAATPGHQS
jgi:hypothetical protein